MVEQNDFVATLFDFCFFVKPCGLSTLSKMHVENLLRSEVGADIWAIRFLGRKQLKVRQKRSLAHGGEACASGQSRQARVERQVLQESQGIQLHFDIASELPHAQARKHSPSVVRRISSQISFQVARTAAEAQAHRTRCANIQLFILLLSRLRVQPIITLPVEPCRFKGAGPWLQPRRLATGCMQMLRPEKSRRSRAGD